HDHPRPDLVRRLGLQADQPRRVDPRHRGRLPAVDGPVSFELEYFDPVDRWQFRGYYHTEAVDGVAVLPFTPPHEGRWRATVVYNGTHAAAPATSGWANLLVAGPLTQAP
ncbi:MAG TPA: hypothetical protein VHV75_04350, partial [Solirubrobacteraceae bacterium]|nr:hypothetical protein [Solirubrobacteraceae bacterium]